MVLVSAYLIAGALSCPLIFKNIRANNKARHLMQKNEFDKCKKIIVTKGILCGTKFNAINSNDNVISKLNLYNATIMHTYGIGLLALCIFSSSSSSNSKNYIVYEHADTLKRFSPDLKINNEEINTDCIVDIFSDDMHEPTYFKVTDITKMYETYAHKNEIIFPYSKFQEYGLKDNTMVYLLKDTTCFKTKLIIANANLHKKLENYIATKYYGKKRLSWIILLFVLSLIIVSYFENEYYMSKYYLNEQ